MMDTSPIEIFNQTNVGLPFSEKEAFLLISNLQKEESVQFDFVEVAFVSESKISEVNKEFLQKEYVTDIISFRYDEDDSNQAIEGTLYCCAPRIMEQANEFNQSPKKEFLRVLIHGLLHLCGYEDSTPTEKKEMTRLEDYYLSNIS